MTGLGKSLSSAGAEPARSFAGELARFRALLAARTCFALVRFGDGELDALLGIPKVGAEFEFHPGDPVYEACRERLLAALRHRGPRYYVGIPCPVCVGREDFEWIYHTAGQDEEHLTWATLFYYSNYRRFIAGFLPLFRERRVVLTCHREAALAGLPFPVAAAIRVGDDAWRHDGAVEEELRALLARRGGALLLFCAGPLGKILIHRLHAEFPDNTYLDVGAALDPYLFVKDGSQRRRFLRFPELQATSCTWPGGAPEDLAACHPQLVVRG
jgi:hypothetical protein